MLAVANQADRGFVVLIRKDKMAIVLLDTKTANFKTRGRLDFGPFIHREDRAFMYFLQMVTPNAQLEGAYFTINTRFANGGDNIRSPLIAKFFPTTTKMAFLVKVPRIRDTNNQQLLIQLQPKEFYRNATTTTEVDIELSWEDDETYRLDDGFP